MTQGEYLAWLARSGGVKSANRDRRTESPGRESDLHDAIIGECRRRGWIYWHARMDKASTWSVGAPDFVILAPGGRTLLVECKRTWGKLSAEQRACVAMAQSLGHRILIVTSLEEFINETRNVSKIAR